MDENGLRADYCRRPHEPGRTFVVVVMKGPAVLARAALRTRPPAAAAAREAPTPVTLLHGPWAPCTAFARLPLLADLATAGFTTGTLDLPGYGASTAPLPATATLDDVVDGARAALAAGLPAAPVLVAHSSGALLAQAYLESFPLAGLVLLCPPPPGTAAWLRRVAGGAGARSDALALLRSAGGDEVGVRRWLLSPDAADDAVSACAADAESAVVDGGGGSDRALCGVAAGARLLELLAATPLRVEPRPVPILVVCAGRDALVSEAEVRSRCV